MPKHSVKKPLTVFVSVLAVLVLGLVAYLRMTPDLLPNMNFPYVVIVTTDPGASPEAVEKEITRPMERSMATLSEIKSVTSTSKNSVSLVMLEFDENVNMDSASLDIQQKINILQSSWDDNVGAPYVLKMNPSMLPVEVVAVGYEGKDIHELSSFAETVLADQLSGISGVASVDVSGVVDSQLHVLLNQEKMDALSQRLEQAMAAQLDKAQGEIHATRGQLQSAKDALHGVQEDAIHAATEDALLAAKDTIDTLQNTRDQLQANLSELADIQAKKLELDAKNAQFHYNMEQIRNDPSLTEEEKTASITEIQNDPEYIQVQSDLAALELRLAALNTSWEEMAQTQQQWQSELQEILRQLETLEQGGYSDLADKLASGAITVTDAATTLVSSGVQLDVTLAQLDQALAQLESSKAGLLQQADLSRVLNIQTLTALLTAQDFSMPAGYIEEDGVSYMVSVGDSVSSQEDLENMVLFDFGLEGVDPIRMSDVADVFITDNSDEIYAKLNGSDSVMVAFTKQSTYATAEVSNNINDRLAQMEEDYPGLTFIPMMDQGMYIYMIVNSIFSSLGWGILFSVLILYLFLRDLRPTVITLCSIPVSLIFAVVLMYFSGVSINMISLSGLAVSVGMLVDNSVVVIENIYRLRSKGATVIQAAVSGAQQVLGAITASTLTTVCVFLPIVFLEGLTRQLFTDLALTMTYALMASLIVALTLVPAMAAGMLKKEKAARPNLLSRVYPHYRKAVQWSLGHKAIVLSLSVVLLISSVGLTLLRGFSFMPTMDMNMANITITPPEGASKATAMELADEVLKRAATIKHVETVGASMNDGSAMGGMGMSSDTPTVSAYMLLTKGESGLAAGKKLETLCADLPCTISSTSPMDGFNYLAGNGISLQVYGDDMTQLHAAAQSLSAAMAQVEGTADVSDGLERSVDALHISVDRNAAMQKGITVAQIYLQVADALTNTASSANMTLDGVDVSVSVESPLATRPTRQTLLDLEISTQPATASPGGDMASMGGNASGGMSTIPSGGTAPQTFKLSEVATVEETVSLNTINHDEQQRYVTVSAGIAEGYNVTRVTADVKKALDSVELPDGVHIDYQGENEEIMNAMRQMLLMLGLGILLVYLVMVAQFQSLRSPFIVMFTIPLAFTGGFLALLLSGKELSVVSLIGLVMLVGVIVNNGIVLVDYINQLRLEGMERREAILEAGVTRLRPILMTSITTILGLVVMAFGNSVGTAMMQPVALVSIGGLLYATIMTLFVVPCMYDTIARKELRHVTEEELETVHF